MFILFAFLTIYESVIQNNRIVLTMAWWVSLGAFLYFALNLISIKTYFDEKPPVISDGPHPFYLWKVLTFINGICMQAGLHLIMLLCFKTEAVAKIDVLLYTGPFALLTLDWIFNRVYIPASVLLWYPLLSYTFFVIYKEVMLVE